MMKRLQQLLMLLGMTAMLSACSKTVHWEEEVPLNTGEVIWVKRYVTYKYKGAGGNPLDMAYRPDSTETLEFTWQNKKYSYRGQALIDLLAISPLTKQPVLVAWAANKDWHFRNNYRCTTPFHVQFVPDSSGRVWTWPPAIEPWLYGLPFNMMRHKPESLGDDVQEKYTHADIARLEKWDVNRNIEYYRISSTKTDSSCFK